MRPDPERLLEARYGIAEAARLIPGLSRATLRSWVVGRSYPLQGGGRGCFEPIFSLPKPDVPLLSFVNLVEAHVLYGLRSNRELSISDLRTAIVYAEEQFGIQHLLAHRDLRTTPGNLLLEHYGDLVNLTKAGQLGLREVLNAYLKRVDYSPSGWAWSLSPILPWAPASRSYVIDPRLAYGRPIIRKHGVPVRVVADRYNGGETIETLARDYELDEEEIHTAITYARAA